MKLTAKNKKRINKYFKYINPEQLYLLCIAKYGFTPIKHKAKVLTKEEVEANRSSAYNYLDLEQRD